MVELPSARLTTTVYSFNLECFTALLEGICAALILCIQALEQSRYKAGYSFEGCYFGDTMGISEGDTESLGNFSLSCFHPTTQVKVHGAVRARYGPVSKRACNA